MKTISEDEVTLLKLNMRHAFRNAELLAGDVLVNFNGICPKTLHQNRRFLAPMTNLINICFETRTASEISLETNFIKKYTFPQQYETEKPDDITLSRFFKNKNVDRKAYFFP